MSARLFLSKVCWIGKRFTAHLSSISYTAFYQLVCHDLFWLQHWAPHSLPKFSGLKLWGGIWSCRICKFCFHWRVISRTIDSSLCPIDGSWSEFSSSWDLRLCYRRSLIDTLKPSRHNKVTPRQPHNFSPLVVTSLVGVSKQVKQLLNQHFGFINKLHSLGLV